MPEFKLLREKFPTIYCNFCAAKSTTAFFDDAKKMTICLECIKFCNKILAEKDKKGTNVPLPPTPAA